MYPCRYLILLLLIVSPLAGQQQTSKPSQLTLDRIFVSDDFHSDAIPFEKWLKGGLFASLQPSKTQTSGMDLVRFDTQGNTEVLVPAEKLIAPNTKDPLRVESYELSQDLDLMLIYTNSARVCWYWLASQNTIWFWTRALRRARRT